MEGLSLGRTTESSTFSLLARVMPACDEDDSYLGTMSGITLRRTEGGESRAEIRKQLESLNILLSI